MSNLIPPANQLFLNDLLHLVQHSPQRAASWHRLFAALAQTPHDQRAPFLERIKDYFESPGLVGIHAHTFAHALSGDTAHLAQASSCWIEADLPLDAGMAIFSTAFASGMQSKRADGLVGYLQASAVVPLLKAMSNKAATEILGKQARERKKSSTIKRIAIFAPMISQALHAPTRMVRDHAALLAGDGLETQVFAPQDMLLGDMPHWLGAPHQIRISPPKPEDLAWLSDIAPVHLAPLHFSMRLRWRWLLERIIQFDPDVVLLIGNASPLLASIWQLYPLVGMGVNAMPPLANLDIWLAPNEEPADPWAPEFFYANRVLYAKRFSLPSPTPHSSRTELGLPEEAVIWVTTGTRLNSELEVAFVQRVLQELNELPHTYWLLVGLDDISQKKFGAMHPRIIAKPYQQNLSAWMAASDIYVNPIRIGAGYSVLLAMATKLAVLTMAYGDGGDKLGDLAVKHAQDFWNMLRTLSTDKAALSEFKQHIASRQAHFSTNNPHEILSAIKLAAG